MLQDLEAKQINDFLEKWHDLTYNEATESQKKQDRQERITKAIKESAAIQQLAENPLLLTMMAILNRNQDLPRDRAKLYERSSELLLDQWDVEGKLLEDPELKGVDIDYTDKQAMLRNVAHFMQATEKGLSGNIISQKNLEKELTKYLKTIDVNPARKVARLMINQLRTRNFILCDVGSNYYAFVHRTFLEYFCAWSYIWQFEKTQTLSIEGIKSEIYGKRWQDESWHETLRLIAGMLEPKFVAQIIQYLIEINIDYDCLFLAADCLVEVDEKQVDIIRKTSEHLCTEIKNLLDTFCTLHPHSRLEIKIIKTIATVWKNHYSTLSWIGQLALSAESEFIRRIAIRTLAEGWHDEPDTLSIIKQCAQSDDDTNVRSNAIGQLASGWHDEPETLSIIKQYAQFDDNSTVRANAISQLAGGWHDESETLSIIKQCAQSDDDGVVRSSAISALARGWRNEPDTFSIVKQCAQSDDSNVRRLVIYDLAEVWHDEPDTLSIIKEQTQSDDNNIVRSNAINTLARGWRNDPKTLELLVNCAVNDPFIRDERSKYTTNPRQTALKAIVEYFPDHPTTKDLLIDRANNDRDEKVREFAQQALEDLSK